MELYCDVCEKDVEADLDPNMAELECDVDSDGLVVGTGYVFFVCPECGEELKAVEVDVEVDTTNSFTYGGDVEWEYTVEDCNVLDVYEEGGDLVVDIEVEVQRECAEGVAVDFRSREPIE